ncbi:MAG: hypothetical protein EOO72_09885, partial [Myxococcaceae bacterium]
MEQEHFALGGFPRAQAEASSRGSIPLRTRRMEVGREVSQRDPAATVRPVVSATPAQLASVAVGRPVRGEF